MENDLKDMEGLNELEHMVHVSTVDLEEKLDILLGKKVSKNGRFKMKEKISKQEKAFLKELKAAHKPGTLAIGMMTMNYLLNFMTKSILIMKNFRRLK